MLFNAERASSTNINGVTQIPCANDEHIEQRRKFTGKLISKKSSQDTLYSDAIVSNDVGSYKLLSHDGRPVADMIEMISMHRGIDELKILMPLMKSFTSKNKRILLVAPPYVAFAPHLVSSGVDIRMLDVVQSDSSCADVISLIEQALHNDEYAMVITWLDWLPNSIVKKLQLAINASKKILVMFRQHEHHNSPVNMQFKIQFNDKNSAKGVQLTLIDQIKLHTQKNSGFGNEVNESTSPIICIDNCLDKGVSGTYH